MSERRLIVGAALLVFVSALVLVAQHILGTPDISRLEPGFPSPDGRYCVYVQVNNYAYAGRVDFSFTLVNRDTSESKVVAGPFQADGYAEWLAQDRVKCYIARGREQLTINLVEVALGVTLEYEIVRRLGPDEIRRFGLENTTVYKESK